MSLKVHDGNWLECGTTINEIKVKISDKELGTVCVTKAIKYKVVYPLEIIVWNTTDLLSNCTKMKIDPVESRLQATVIEGKNETKDCIKFLKVVLKDVPSTTFLSIGDHPLMMSDFLGVWRGVKQNRTKLDKGGR